MKQKVNHINLRDYLKKRKIPFRPDLVIQLIYKRDQILPMFAQKKAKKYIVPVKDCIHCNKRKNKATDLLSQLNTRELFCKKHAAIYDYEQCKGKIAKLRYKDKTYYLFGEYIATQMHSDPEGLYIIWMGTIKQNSFSVFAINKRYFPDIEKANIDITDDILSADTLQINEWLLIMDKEKPILEKVNI